MAVTYYITARHQLDSLPGPGEREEGLIRKVRAAFSAGVDYVQVREKDLPAGRVADLVETLAGLPEKRNCRLLVNERWDIAGSCGADGVHLPSDSSLLPLIRARAGESIILGVSCHGKEDVARAAGEGASYVLLGPIFETPSKPGVKPLGLATLSEICRSFRVHIYALGGINARNAEDCIGAGAAGVAGIRLFQQEQDIEALCRRLSFLENKDWRVND